MSSPVGSHPPGHGRSSLGALSVAALGVVYGDIGTSPLYAMRESFKAAHGTRVTEANVLGILSLFFWALTLVIVVKYLTFVMRADNDGEGGTFALIALLEPKAIEKTKSGIALVLLGLFGAALLSGEGIITPAVSVLGAVEGLKEATGAFEPYVVYISVAIIVGLFALQKRGTGGVGAIFGPFMLVWFATIAIIGLRWIIKRPDVLQAVDPRHAVRFFAHDRVHGFFLLGSVVLCITGGEALYADMGHFGKAPIRFAWYAVVFPALLLNYFGQGALLLSRPTESHSFFGLVDGWHKIPLSAIAMAAACIASQALISGAFSLARAAVQLGFFPRVSIVHTSGSSEGQIYVPEVNWGLLVACVTLVVGFGSSSKLAAAYGIAVTGTMSITSVLFFAIARRRWKWGILPAAALTLLFLAVDLSFFSANLPKLGSGGWVPLAIGAVVFTVMTTWRRGRALLGQRYLAQTLPLDLFMADIEATRPHRVQGTAVFMTSNPKGAPPVLLHHFKHNKTLCEQVLLLSIATRHVPEVPRRSRIVELNDIGQGFYQVTAAYGFMQTPNVLELMDLCAEKGLETRRADTSFFLGRETLLITDERGMARWRKVLFAFLSRNARPANAFFRIPPNRVVELGTQIEL
ncbi:MAG: potassium transporter Kup [Labilithrix sp.]|nr:potassium transporter Kup [Labilithrix sp.]